MKEKADDNWVLLYKVLKYILNKNMNKDYLYNLINKDKLQSLYNRDLKIMNKHYEMKEIE